MTRDGLRARLDRAQQLTASYDARLGYPILSYLSGAGRRTADEVAEGLGVSWHAAMIALAALVAVGLIEVHRADAGGGAAYCLPAGVRVLVDTEGPVSA